MSLGRGCDRQAERARGRHVLICRTRGPGKPTGLGNAQGACAEQSYEEQLCTEHLLSVRPWAKPLTLSGRGHTAGCDPSQQFPNPCNLRRQREAGILEWTSPYVLQSGHPVCCTLVLALLPGFSIPRGVAARLFHARIQAVKGRRGQLAQVGRQATAGKRGSGAA